jgi:hypothetical protein
MNLAVSEIRISQDRTRRFFVLETGKVLGTSDDTDDEAEILSAKLKGEEIVYLHDRIFYTEVLDFEKKEISLQSCDPDPGALYISLQERELVPSRKIEWK